MKSLLGRITSLPSGFEVASRERRLLAQGMLRRVHIPKSELLDCQEPQKHPRPSYPNTTRTRPRASSQSTTLSSTTESSASSYRSTSSSTTRLKDSTTEYSIRSDSSATSRLNAPFDGRCQINAPFLPHAGSIPPPRISRSSPSTSMATETQKPGLEWSNIYVLVFTDFVILAKPVLEKTQPTRGLRGIEIYEKCSTLDALGVFWVLGVMDHSGYCGK